MAGSQAPPGSQAPQWRFLISPRWIAWHLIMVASVAGMLALGNWQLRRAEAGNGLSWAYTFEWPIFAIFAVVFWAKTISDEFRPPATAESGQADLPLPAGAMPAGAAPSAGGPPGGPAAAGEDTELAAYNAYLARLHREVKGHGKWHGLR
jgi:hypothetical protein